MHWILVCSYGLFTCRGTVYNRAVLQDTTRQFCRLPQIWKRVGCVPAKRENTLSPPFLTTELSTHSAHHHHQNYCVYRVAKKERGKQRSKRSKKKRACRIGALEWKTNWWWMYLDKTTYYWTPCHRTAPGWEWLDGSSLLYK